MLAKQANDPRNPAQFIITTFHPQIIHETDKVYGVAHQNRISRCGFSGCPVLTNLPHSCSFLAPTSGLKKCGASSTQPLYLLFCRIDVIEKVDALAFLQVEENKQKTTE